jgi:hypothetical protein
MIMFIIESRLEDLGSDWMFNRGWTIRSAKCY